MIEKQRIANIIEWFKTNMPVVGTELNFKTHFQLLVATILSAQCTDKRVNLITPKLFEHYPDSKSMSKATTAEIYELIKSCSYPNNKAKNLAAMSKMLTTNFNGKVPEEIDQLQTLPGVGRKTANVVASVAFNKPAMAVDTHVFRTSARLGLTKNAKTPLDTEKQLVAIIAPHDIPNAHHWLILHGRYVCTARRPKCNLCGLTKLCLYFNEQGKEEKQSTKQKNENKKIARHPKSD